MSQRYALGSEGAWVELRDATELKAGDQMDIQDAMDADGTGKMLRQMFNALMVALVVNWQLPVQLPIPSLAPESLRMMEIRDYQALKKLVEPAQDLVFPSNPEPEDPAALEAAQADLASPTGAAVES